MALFQLLLNGGGDGRAASVGIVGHFVEPQAVIVVLQLSEGLHSSVEVVVDNGKAVSVVVERFPPGVVQVLGIVGEVHAALQDVFTSHRCERVEIQAYDKIGIIGDESCQLVVDGLLVELQLVELTELEVEISILIII